MADFNKMLQKLQFQDLKIEPGLNEASFTKGETNSGYHILELMHDLYLVTISDPGEGESSRGDIHIVTNGANLQYCRLAPPLRSSWVQSYGKPMVSFATNLAHSFTQR